MDMVTWRAILFVLICACMPLTRPGRAADWWTVGGDGQRDGWEKSEQSFSRDEVKDFQLLWQRKLGDTKAGVRALLPVLVESISAYRGAHELAIVAGSDHHVWSLDADQVFWTRRFETAGAVSKKKGCVADSSAAPTVAPSVATRQGKTGQSSSFVPPRPIYSLTGDGMLHRIAPSDGFDMGKDLPFVPAGLRTHPLVVSRDTVYTVSGAGCGTSPAVWSIDTVAEGSKPNSFELGSEAAGLDGVALGSDGTVFVKTEDGPFEPGNGRYGGALLALTKDLALFQYFVMPQNEGKTPAAGMNGTSPLVVTFKGQELVIAAASDGCLYVLRATSLGSVDHHHYLAKSVVVPATDGRPGHGIWGALSSFQAADGSRYVLVPVWGPLSTDMQAALRKTSAPNGSIVAFKVVPDEGGAPTLTPAWVSRDLDSPSPPGIANGVVFALANGKFDDGKKARKNSHATLFAFDGLTGQQLYSTGDQVTAAGNLAGLSVASGRVYFATMDNTLHVFGLAPGKETTH